MGSLIYIYIYIFPDFFFSKHLKKNVDHFCCSWTCLVFLTPECWFRCLDRHFEQVWASGGPLLDLKWHRFIWTCTLVQPTSNLPQPTSNLVQPRSILLQPRSEKSNSQIPESGFLYDIDCGLYMILNGSIYMTEDVGIYMIANLANRTTNGVCMITNVADIITNVADGITNVAVIWLWLQMSQIWLHMSQIWLQMSQL